MFFLYKEGRDWIRSLYELVPLGESHKHKIVDHLDQTVRAVIKGMLVTALVQGLLAGAAYAVLGVPFPIVLTALTIILAPIPFGGTALVWGPVVMYLVWAGFSAKGLVMLAWGVGVISTVDQVLRPWLIGKDVPIPVLFLVFSVLGGLAMYGPIGLFVGPVLVSVFMTALQIYREEYHADEQPRPGSPPNPPRSSVSNRWFVARLFHRNRDRNAAHDIVDLEIPLGAQRVAVVAIDAGG